MIAGWRDAGLPIGTDNGEGVSYASLAAKAGVWRRKSVVVLKRL